MTQRLFRLALLFLSAVMGWAFGFIKLPYIERNYSFWLGFVACFTLIAFIIAIYWEWNNNKEIKLFENANNPETGKQKQSITKNKIPLYFIFFALLLLCILSYFKMQRTKEKLNLANAEINEVKYNANLELQRINISLLLDLINKLDSTKMNFQDKSSVDNMIDRIVSLSSSFKIHKVWDMENKVFQSISSERGLLLLALLKTNMDSNYFKKIKENVSFYGADLRNADFHGLNLSGIDLKNANLQYANLQGTNLNNANLNDAILVGANLNQASLVGANLIGAKLNWAKINEADLQMAKLDSIDLSNATLQKSKLNHAVLLQAILCNAIFYEADLNYSYLMYTNLSNVNFAKALLTHTVFSRTDLGSTILNEAIVKENWIEGLHENKNKGVNLIHEKYQIICDSTTIQDSLIYRLIPNSN